MADYGREDDSKHYHEDVVVQPELEEGDQELMRGEVLGADETLRARYRMPPKEDGSRRILSRVERHNG